MTSVRAEVFGISTLIAFHVLVNVRTALSEEGEGGSLLTASLLVAQVLTFCPG